MKKKPNQVRAKSRPNWKLMSVKDRAKFKAKHPALCAAMAPSAFGGRKAGKKPLFMSVKESKTRVKSARIPRKDWVRVKSQEMNRVVL